MWQSGCNDVGPPVDPVGAGKQTYQLAPLFFHTPALGVDLLQGVRPRELPDKSIFARTLTSTPLSPRSRRYCCRLLVLTTLAVHPPRRHQAGTGVHGGHGRQSQQIRFRPTRKLDFRPILRPHTRGPTLRGEHLGATPLSHHISHRERQFVPCFGRFCAGSLYGEIVACNRNGVGFAPSAQLSEQRACTLAPLMHSRDFEVDRPSVRENGRKDPNGGDIALRVGMYPPSRRPHVYTRTHTGVRTLSLSVWA